MKNQETLYNKLWKAGLVYGLMGLALYWAWIVGGSFIHLNMFIYKQLGVSVLIEGAILFYISILVLTIVFCASMMHAPPAKDVKKIRRRCKIALTWALIPGLSFLLPLALFVYGVVMGGVNGAAFLIVLFENIYKKDDEE